jgi:3'-phosphoadenosine 5'-phosphosulfate sulfotransferase (PAPS reductase)/FAD synthetase
MKPTVLRASERVKHIVGFSGGIDSQACARWVLNRFPKEDVILTNSDAGGNEHPLTVEFIDWYSENVHPVVRVNAIVADMWKTPGAAEERGYRSEATLTFDLMAEIKGRFPSRKMQFCTENLKLNPQKRWIEKEFGPGGQFDGCSYVRYTGVRRDESAARAQTPYQQWDDWYDCELFAPIFDWTKKMCFDYVDTYGEQFNPLYKLGFNRVGCAPCVNSGKDDIANWSERSPEMIDKVREWEKRVGRTFFPPCVPGMELNFVDDVVRWARSARGGRQDMFPIMHERPACESKYGLCE